MDQEGSKEYQASPEKMSQFRSISPNNVAYLKLLLNRIMPLMKDLAGPEQCSFIPGRQIGKGNLTSLLNFGKKFLKFVFGNVAFIWFFKLLISIAPPTCGVSLFLPNVHMKSFDIPFPQTQSNGWPCISYYSFLSKCHHLIYM